MSDSIFHQLAEQLQQQNLEHFQKQLMEHQQKVPTQHTPSQTPLVLSFTARSIHTGALASSLEAQELTSQNKAALVPFRTPTCLISY